MDETRRELLRRNLFRAGGAMGAAVVVKFLSPKEARACDPTTLISNCFLKGTLITTFGGEKPIEELRVGDKLLTLLRGTSTVQEITRLSPAAVAPVVIKAGALAHLVPTSDLYVTEHHALLIDDELIAAGNLINGRTVYRADFKSDEYFNIRLTGHDVIFANGVRCESLYDEAREQSCMLRVRYRSRWSEAAGYLRSAFSPIVDFRRPADLVRDRLDLAA